MFYSHHRASTCSPRSSSYFYIIYFCILAVFISMIAACQNASSDSMNQDDSTVTSYSVTLNKSGDGDGFILSTPTGLDCNEACTTKTVTFTEATDGYMNNAGAVVQQVTEQKVKYILLNANPSRDAWFTQWDCQANGRDATGEYTWSQQSFTEDVRVVVGIVNSNENDHMTPLEAICSVNFRRIYNLNIIKSSPANVTPGTGSVIGTLQKPSQQGAGQRIQCGTDCRGSYFFEEVETLTATPDPGSVFVEWKLGCNVNDRQNPVTTLVMDEDLNCEAVFAAESP
jgi:hypothetical protein